MKIMRRVYARDWIVSLMTFICLILTIYFVVEAKNNSNRLVQIAEYNRQLNQSNTDILKEIKDCTRPGGACYQESAKRTSGVVGDINKVAVYASYCATRQPAPASADEVKACVEDLVKQSSHVKVNSAP